MSDRPDLFPNSDEGRLSLLPGVLDMEFEPPQAGLQRGRFTAARKHMAPNGFMHAGAVVTLADSCAGVGCFGNLPEGATGFTTIELKSNFLGTAQLGQGVACEAKLVHGGRLTQVWDATVRLEEAGKVIALFRATQMILYPRGA